MKDEKQESVLSTTSFINDLLSFTSYFLSFHQTHSFTTQEDLTFLTKMKAFSSVSLTVCLLSSLVSAAIDNSTFALISRYEQYAAAFYCDSNNQANNSQKIACTDMNANNCPTVQVANSTVRFAFK